MTNQLGIEQTDYSIKPLETIEAPMRWQELGLSYTASGYGSKIPTRYMVKHNNRMKRVYCALYGNSGTCYIIHGAKKLTIEEG